MAKRLRRYIYGPQYFSHGTEAWCRYRHNEYLLLKYQLFEQRHIAIRRKRNAK